MTIELCLLTGLLCVIQPFPARGLSATDMPVLKGLAPVTVSSKTPEGTAALAANYTVTGAIRTGVVKQSGLLPFAEQQQQALQDPFITGADLAQLADGLATTVGSAYPARAHYLDRRNSRACPSR